jgi:hypothetical protein
VETLVSRADDLTFAFVAFASFPVVDEMIGDSRHDVRIVGGGPAGVATALFQPAQRGWHLDRRRFDEMLAREAASRGVVLYRDSKFLDSQLDGSKRFRLAILQTGYVRFSKIRGPLEERV